LMGITGKYGIFQYSDLMDFNRIYWTLVWCKVDLIWSTGIWQWLNGIQYRDSIAIYKIELNVITGIYWGLCFFKYNSDLMESNCHLIMISLDLVDFLEFSEN
jgi:hypothetical protein